MFSLTPDNYRDDRNSGQIMREKTSNFFDFLTTLFHTALSFIRTTDGLNLEYFRNFSRDRSGHNITSARLVYDSVHGIAGRLNTYQPQHKQHDALWKMRLRSFINRLIKQIELRVTKKYSFIQIPPTKSKHLPALHSTLDQNQIMKL